MYRTVLTVIFAAFLLTTVPFGAYAQENETHYPMDCGDNCSQIDEGPPGWYTEPMITHSNDFAFQSDLEEEWYTGIEQDFLPNITSFTWNGSIGDGYVNFSHTGELIEDQETDNYQIYTNDGVWHTTGDEFFPKRNKTFEIDFRSEIDDIQSGNYQIRLELGRHILHFEDFQADGNPSRVSWNYDQYQDSIAEQDAVTGIETTDWTTVRFTQNTVGGTTYINATLVASDGSEHTLTMEVGNGYIGGTHDMAVNMTGTALELNTYGGSFQFDNMYTNYPNTNYQTYGGSFYLQHSQPDNNGTGIRLPGFNRSEPTRRIIDDTGLYEYDNVSHDVSNGFTWNYEEIYTPTMAHGEGYLNFLVESTEIDGDNVGLRHNFTTATEGGSQSWKISWLRNNNIQSTRTLETDFNVWEYSWNQTIETNLTHAKVDIEVFNETFDVQRDYEVTFELDNYLSDTDSANMHMEGYGIGYSGQENLEVYVINNTFTEGYTSLQPPSEDPGNGGTGEIGDESENLDFRIQKDTLNPGEKTDYTVVYNTNTQVANESTYQVENPNIVTVYESNNTIVATNNSDYYNTSTQVTATYGNLSSTDSVYVGFVSSENLAGGDENGTESGGGLTSKLNYDKLTAFVLIMNERTVQLIFLIIILNTALAKLTNPFVGIGFTVPMLLIGMIVGILPFGMVLFGIIMVIVLGINLKSTMRRRI